MYEDYNNINFVLGSFLLPSLLINQTNYWLRLVVGNLMIDLYQIYEMSIRLRL